MATPKDTTLRPNPTQLTDGKQKLSRYESLSSSQFSSTLPISKQPLTPQHSSKGNNGAFLSTPDDESDTQKYVIKRNGQVVFLEDEQEAASTSTAARFGQKTTGVSAQQREIEVRRERKWLEMFLKWEQWHTKKDHIKERTRKGIPESLRGVFWSLFADANTIRIQKYKELGLDPTVISVRQLTQGQLVAKVASSNSFDKDDFASVLRTNSFLSNQETSFTDRQSYLLDPHDPAQAIHALRREQLQQQQNDNNKIEKSISKLSKSSQSSTKENFEQNFHPKPPKSPGKPTKRDQQLSPNTSSTSISIPTQHPHQSNSSPTNQNSSQSITLGGNLATQSQHSRQSNPHLPKLESLNEQPDTDDSHQQLSHSNSTSNLTPRHLSSTNGLDLTTNQLTLQLDSQPNIHKGGKKQTNAPPPPRTTGPDGLQIQRASSNLNSTTVNQQQHDLFPYNGLIHSASSGLIMDGSHHLYHSPLGHSTSFDQQLNSQPTPPSSTTQLGSLPQSSSLPTADSASYQHHHQNIPIIPEHDTKISNQHSNSNSQQNSSFPPPPPHSPQQQLRQPPPLRPQLSIESPPSISNSSTNTTTTAVTTTSPGQFTMQLPRPVSQSGPQDIASSLQIKSFNIHRDHNNNNNEFTLNDNINIAAELNDTSQSTEVSRIGHSELQQLKTDKLGHNNHNNHEDTETSEDYILINDPTQTVITINSSMTFTGDQTNISPSQRQQSTTTQPPPPPRNSIRNELAPLQTSTSCLTENQSTTEPTNKDQQTNPITPSSHSVHPQAPTTPSNSTSNHNSNPVLILTPSKKPKQHTSMNNNNSNNNTSMNATGSDSNYEKDTTLSIISLEPIQSISPSCLQDELLFSYTLSPGETIPPEWSLYKRLASTPSEFDQLIGKDVKRTFADHVIFSANTSVSGMSQRSTMIASPTTNDEKKSTTISRGRQFLADICRAYCHYDTDLGYCQGISFLVATLLMYMEAEDAFWVLVSLLQHPRYNLRGLFTTGFPLLNEYMYITRELMKKVDNKLYKHLEKNDFSYSICMPQWFMGLYVYTLPLSIGLRIWDSLLYEGHKILVRTALYMLTYYRKKLLEQPDIDGILQVLCHDVPHSPDMYVDADKFMNGVHKISISTEDVEKLSMKYRKEMEAQEKKDKENGNNSNKRK